MDYWSLWHFEMTIHGRTGTIDAWPIKTIPNQIRCVKSSNRSSTYSTGFERWLTPCSIHIKDVHKYWSTPGNHSSLERMETLYPRIWTHHRHILWSQKPDVLQNSSEIEQQTSQMVTLLIRIWHQTDTSARIKNDSIRRPIMMTRSWNWRTIGRRRNNHVTRKHVYQSVGHQFTRKNIEWERTGHRCEKRYGNTITRRTY